MTQIKEHLSRLLARTPLVTFVLIPLVVIACELIIGDGVLALDL